MRAGLLKANTNTKEVFSQVIRNFVSQALETILPFLSRKRVINVPQEDLVRILVDTSPKVSLMTTETKSALGNIGKLTRIA